MTSMMEERRTTVEGGSHEAERGPRRPGWAGRRLQGRRCKQERPKGSGRAEGREREGCGGKGGKAGRRGVTGKS